MLTLMSLTVKSKNTEPLKSDLSDEGDDPLRAVFVHVRQVNFVTEEHKPFAELHRSQNHAVRSPAVLAVMIERLQKKLWGCGTGEVQTHNLMKKAMQ